MWHVGQGWGRPSEKYDFLHDLDYRLPEGRDHAKPFPVVQSVAWGT